MDDKDLFEQLSSGPFSRSGFDENLRRKINDNLDNPRRGAKRPSFLRLSVISASFLFIAIVIGALWSWRSFDGAEKSQKLAVPTGQASASSAVEDEDETNKTPHSAVVIGLRKDEDNRRSSYRTVVVAPENDRLIEIGSGNGIWMPYGTKFYQIEATDDSLGKGDQRLVAYLEGKRSKQKDTDAAQLRRTEKLLYAGDKYVSILQTTNIDVKGAKVEQSEVVVNQLPTLALANRAANPDALTAGNVSLGEALETQDPVAQVERWAVVREKNAWVAKQAVKTSGVYDVAQIRQWPSVDVSLTNTKVVKDKPLTIDWAEVERIEPDAVDAYTSKDGDVALIVSDDQLKLVAHRLPEAERSSVTIDLAPNESIVMVQWAIQENYVNTWKQWFTEWFSDSSH